MNPQPNSIWDNHESRREVPGAAAAEIQKWEASNRVTLPTSLRDALKSRNGGRIRYSEIRVRSLVKISRPDEEFWSLADYSKRLFKDKRLVFEFADGERGEPQYLLNFNANGPTGEPSVHHYFGDPGEIHDETVTVEEFFKQLLAAGHQPSVDWFEINKLENVLFREVMIRNFGEAQIKVESVVGRQEDRLFVYRHEVMAEDESFLKLSFSEPVDPNETMIEMIPSSPPTYYMRLVPKDRDKAIRIESRRMPDGRWKDGGFSVLDQVESINKNDLWKLRTKLLGSRAAAKADAAQREHNEIYTLAEKMRSLPRDDRKALGESMAASVLKGAMDTFKGKALNMEALKKSSLKQLRNTAGNGSRTRKK